MEPMSAEEYNQKLSAFREKQTQTKADDMTLRRSGSVPPKRPTIPMLAPDGQDFVAVFPEEVSTDMLKGFVDTKKISNEKAVFNKESGWIPTKGK